MEAAAVEWGWGVYFDFSWIEAVMTYLCSGFLVFYWWCVMRDYLLETSVWQLIVYDLSFCTILLWAPVSSPWSLPHIAPPIRPLSTLGVVPEKRRWQGASLDNPRGVRLKSLRPDLPCPTTSGTTHKIISLKMSCKEERLLCLGLVAKVAADPTPE